MKKLNILILSWRGPGHPNAGGAELSTHEHAKAWVKAGNSVTLFTSDFAGAGREEIIDGVQIIRKGSDVFGVHINAFLWYLFSNHLEFDLVIDQFHGIPFFTPLYVRTKKLGFIHEVTKEIWWLNPWPKPFNFFPSVIGSFFEPLIFKLFYKNVPFMTVSESTKNDLVNWGIIPENIKVFHNGVNIVSTKVKKEKKRILIFLGALAKDKGIEDALETFALVYKKDKKLQFWVVGLGSPSYLKELKSRCRDLGIEKKTKFWGFVNNGKKFELLSEASVLINPSVREGWGLVNIEANSAGTPVVGYDVPGVRDSVIDGKTGLLSKFGDVESLAENVLVLCNNMGLYKTIAQKAKVWAKQFTWARATRQSFCFIESLFSNKDVD